MLRIWHYAVWWERRGCSPLPLAGVRRQWLSLWTVRPARRYGPVIIPHQGRPWLLWSSDVSTWRVLVSAWNPWLLAWWLVDRAGGFALRAYYALVTWCLDFGLLADPGEGVAIVHRRLWCTLSLRPRTLLWRIHAPCQRRQAAAQSGFQSASSFIAADADALARENARMRDIISQTWAVLLPVVEVYEQVARLRPESHSMDAPQVPSLRDLLEMFAGPADAVEGK